MYLCLYCKVIFHYRDEMYTFDVADDEDPLYCLDCMEAILDEVG